MKKFVAAALLAIVLGQATSALAWGQTETRTLHIYTERLAVKLNDGTRATAVVDYTITAAFRIDEEGSAGAFNDDRSCHFRGQPRTFHRTIQVKMAGGNTLDLGAKDVALPTATDYNFSQNCGEVIGQLDQKFNEVLGNEGVWRQNINEDEMQVKTMLRLIGTLDPS